MRRITRTLLLARLALLTTACGASPDIYAPEAEAAIDNEAVLESATSCPGLELSVFDHSTGTTSTLSLPAVEIAASITAPDLWCHPAQELVHVFSRGSEWAVLGADGQPRAIPVIGVGYNGSRAVIQYADPDAGNQAHTAYVGCEAPPTVTASATRFESRSTSAGSARISGTLGQDEHGATVWRLTCDFYAPSAELYVSRRLPPVLASGEGS